MFMLFFSEKMLFDRDLGLFEPDATNMIHPREDNYQDGDVWWEFQDGPLGPKRRPCRPHLLRWAPPL